MWMEEHLGTRINLERVGEALAVRPETACVACPYCMTMFEDGLKDKKAEPSLSGISPRSRLRPLISNEMLIRTVERSGERSIGAGG